MTCRKAFTFAKVIETERPWEDLARADLRGKFDADPTPEEIAEWVQFMKS
jgi:hypothetical protein